MRGCVMFGSGSGSGGEAKSGLLGHVCVMASLCVATAWLMLSASVSRAMVSKSDAKPCGGAEAPGREERTVVEGLPWRLLAVPIGS